MRMHSNKDTSIMDLQALQSLSCALIDPLSDAPG